MASGFKFGFHVAESADQKTDASEERDIIQKSHSNESKHQKLRIAEEIILQSRHEDDATQHLNANEIFSVPKECICQLHYVPASAVNAKFIQEFGTRSFLNGSPEQTSDLIPGQYEGGLKVWECAFDLANYLYSNDLNFLNAEILEIGCGAGLPGIAALLKGCTVYFQDYNSEVINLSTIPNVIINSRLQDKNCILKSSRFYAGDWKSFHQLLQSQGGAHRFQYILTSETIYNPENYGALYALFRTFLKKSGAVYLAAKHVYFGLAGSIRLFSSYINRNGDFDINPCWSSGETGMKREIIKLTFKESPSDAR